MNDTLWWCRCNSEDCDARWRGMGDEECWACGGEGRREISAAPRLTSGPIMHGMTDEEWARIKRRENCD